MEHISSGRRILNEIRKQKKAEALYQQQEAENLRQKEMAKNQRKKIIFIRRLMAVSILIIGLSSIISFASDFFSEETYQAMLAEEVKDYTEVKRTIYSGQTAWDIQANLLKEAGVENDVRNVLLLVQYVNDIQNLGDIKAGQEIIFLIPKNSK